VQFIGDKLLPPLFDGYNTVVRLQPRGDVDELVTAALPTRTVIMDDGGELSVWEPGFGKWKCIWGDDSTKLLLNEDDVDHGSGK